MAQEAVDAIRQAETTAAALIKDATSKQDAMLQKAKEDVERNKNDTIKAAASKKISELEKINVQNESLLNEATEQAKEDIKKLEESSDLRKKEAIELVIGTLV